MTGMGGSGKSWREVRAGFIFTASEVHMGRRCPLCVKGVNLGDRVIYQETDSDLAHFDCVVEGVGDG